MIQLLVGTKGTGKTKALISSVEIAVKTEKGDVVCITKGDKLNSSFSRKVRLINIADFDISSFKVFYGFICGVISQNYDTTHIFIDRATRIVKDDLTAFAQFMNYLEDVSEKFGVSFTITLSADVSEIPESLSQYSIDFLTTC